MQVSEAYRRLTKPSHGRRTLLPPTHVVAIVMVPIGNEAPLALLTLGSARVEVIGISTELKRATFGLRDVPPTIATWHQFCPQVMHIRRRWVL